MRAIRELVIHHSATRADDAESIKAAHIKRGYATIGYHEVITNGRGGPDGQIQRGRDHRLAGSAVKGANSGKLHVCLVGNFEQGDPGYTGRPTVEQLGSLGWWLLVNGNRYEMLDYRRVKSHGEVALPKYPTACAGNQMPMRYIREWFRDNIGKYEDRSFEGLVSYLARKGWRS
jgi:hypothetical protein